MSFHLDLERITQMPIKYIERLDRKYIKEHPDCYFIFGDNTERTGFGGQAKEARGEPNSIGIATKRAPGMNPEDFFDDYSVKDMDVLCSDLEKIETLLIENKTVYFPVAGVGTGLSSMKQYAPFTFRVLENEIERMFREYP